MNNFRFHTAININSAKEIFSKNENAKFLSGGMTLLPSMKHGLIQPDHLIDLCQIPQFNQIQETQDQIVIGAATHHETVANNSIVHQSIPGLAYLASQIGDPQVRARGTIGGSLANNDPAADYPAGALALKAQLVTDRRVIPAEQFFTGFYSTALEEDEIIQEIRFAKPLKSAYEKCKQSASGYALAGVFIAVYPNDEIRVAVTGVGAGVFLWHEAEKAFMGSSEKPLLERDDLISDLHAPNAYRVNMAQLLFKKAVAKIKNNS
jgi:aerobic carbon-monoxide dehydrogenase medium subunit